MASQEEPASNMRGLLLAVSLTRVTT